MEQRPVCLTIGGSDSCGGAGIQADLRVFEALGVQGCSAITALTAQNPGKVTHIQASSPEQFEAEIRAIADYYTIACIKTGMLQDTEHLSMLCRLKKELLPDTPMVVDPVLISSSSKQLYDSNDIINDYRKLITLATIWTPNLQEAAFFLQHDIDDAVEAASELLLKFSTPVLLKGGHGDSTQLQDIFCDLDGSVEMLEHAKIAMSVSSSHGTGCRLASAIAAHIARGENLSSAVSASHQWFQQQLRTLESPLTQQ